MKKHIGLLVGLLCLTIAASAQKKIVENPLIDLYKQRIVIYTDSTFKARKELSTDLLKFRLLEWKDGLWKAEKRRLASEPVEVVYIRDGEFVRTPEYREVLESYDPKFKGYHKAYYNHLVKAYGKKIANGIYYGVPVIGMNKRQFFMCMERPSETNSTGMAGNASEQLVYRYGDAGTKYYYFTNNKLTTIQN